MSETQVTEVLNRVWAEYREMPGLALNVAQARRLWNLDELQCQGILDKMVELELLCLTSRGMYVLRGPA